MPDVEKTEEEVAAEAAELAVVAEAEKAEAELSAGFTGVDPKPTEETPLVEGDPVVEPVVAEVVPEPAVIPEIPLAKITEAQFNDVLAKANSVEEVRAAFAKYQRDAGGRIGGLEKTLKDLREAAQSGSSLEVSEADLEEVSKEYPDLAKAIAKDLAKVFGKAKPPVPVVAPEPAVDFVPLVQDGVAKAKQELAEQRHLEITQEIAESYPDWRAITGERNSITPYRQWLHAQGEGYELLVLNSKVPSTIVKSLDKFKAFEIAKTKPSTAVPGKTTRSERLAEAIPAKGGGGSPPIPKAQTPEEQLAEGFANK